MLLTYRGSVNRWECDENDHLNVRFYVARHVEALEAGLVAMGCKQAALNLNERIHAQHIRFLKESRIAAPMSGYFGLVDAPIENGGAVQAYTELRHSLTDEILCTCIHDLSEELIVDRQHDSMVVTVPKDGQPRGVPIAEPAHLRLARTELEQSGFRLIGRGVVSVGEVSQFGNLSIQNFMGRLSDSMPHLWALLESDTMVPEHEGGAVLEYRLRYHKPMKTGSSFGIYSGLLGTGSKVQTFAHLIYDEATSTLVASAESCGVRMDLKLRKAVKLSDERIAAMNKFVLKV